MSAAFGIPNLPGYRQSRVLNPHGRRVPLPQPPQPQFRQPPPPSMNVNARVATFIFPYTTILGLFQIYNAI
jgi:hypothetical protein